MFKYKTLLQVNIEGMDVGYCKIADQFRVAIGTDDSRVAIFDHTYARPVNIFEAFEPGRKVMAVRWSPNLQHLIVTSDARELKVYEFKQPIIIEENVILRMRKQPVLLFELSPKELKSPIVWISFVDESPFLALLLDEEDEMHVLEHKKHIFSFRAYLSQLPLKFNQVFETSTIDFRSGDGSKGTLLAVGSMQYVTICLLRPYFEVLMVYDKEKHGKNIPKQGYAHVSFRREPLGLLIVWDKFAQILNLDISSVEPLAHRVSSSGMQLMPESTLLAGMLSNTLVYHMSQSGFKVYPTAGFADEK